MQGRTTYTPWQLLEAFEMPQKVRVTRGWLTDREENSLSEGEAMCVSIGWPFAHPASSLTCLDGHLCLADQAVLYS